jgi:hypothetical protein
MTAVDPKLIQCSLKSLIRYAGSKVDVTQRAWLTRLLDWLNAGPTKAVTTAVNEIGLLEDTQTDGTLCLKDFWWILDKNALVSSFEEMLLFLYRLVCNFLCFTAASRERVTFHAFAHVAGVCSRHSFDSSTHTHP